MKLTVCATLLLLLMAGLTLIQATSSTDASLQALNETGGWEVPGHGRRP